MDAVKPEKAKPPGRPASEMVLIGLLVLAVFAGVFFLSQVFLKPQADTTLDGVHVVGSKENFARLLAADPIRVQMNLFSGNDSRNTALTKVTAEIASTLVQYGKHPRVYGLIEGKSEINCNAETGNCTGAVIVVQLGNCNCLRAETDYVLVEGTPEFFADFTHVKVYKGVLGLAVAG